MSILNQDFEDFELLICDDGSSDETPAIVREFEQRDSRVRATYLATNKGISYALNRLIDSARGEFLARMDADDIAMPNRLSVQLTEFPEHDEPVVSFAALERIDENGNRKGFRTPPNNDFCFHLRFENPFIHPLLFTRTRLIRSFRYRKVPYAEDYELLVRMAKAGVNFHVSKHVLLAHRTVRNKVKNPRKIYLQMISRMRIRQFLRRGAATSNLVDPEEFYNRFDFQKFMNKWPVYLSCVGKSGRSRQGKLMLLMNYTRLDPLVRAEVRNMVRYSVSRRFR